MARTPKFDWERIRAEYEAGASQSELSRRYGVSRKALQNHIAAEGWTQDVEPAIHRKVAEKVAGIVAGSDPQKKAEAIDAEAERRAAKVHQHQEEWEANKAVSDEAILKRDFELAKLAKITAETIKIRQDGERKAFGLDPKEAPPPVAPGDELRKLTDEELDASIARSQARIAQAAAELSAARRGEETPGGEG